MAAGKGRGALTGPTQAADADSGKGSSSGSSTCSTHPVLAWPEGDSIRGGCQGGGGTCSTCPVTDSLLQCKFHMYEVVYPEGFRIEELGPKPH